MNVVDRNNVVIRGEGEQVIVFAHGYGCSQNMWRLVAPAFEKDHQVLLFDHVGSGNSKVSAYDKSKYGNLNGYAGDLVEICQALDLERVIYVGHSVSAMIGILAAIRQPKLFEKMVLIGPSPRYIDEGHYIGGFSPQAMKELLSSLEDNFASWSQAIAPVIMWQHAGENLSTELAASFCSLKPEIAKHFAQVVFTGDNREDLKKVAVDSLILQCRDDAVAPEAVGQYVHREMKKSQYVLMNAKGHCPHMSSPQETIDCIRAFLKPNETSDEARGYSVPTGAQR